MAAQHLPQDPVRPSSGYEELAQKKNNTKMYPQLAWSDSFEPQFSKEMFRIMLKSESILFVCASWNWSILIITNQTQKSFLKRFQFIKNEVLLP